MAEAEFGQGAGGGRFLVHARRQARSRQGIRDRAYSRRGVLRHRRAFGSYYRRCPICCRRRSNSPATPARWASAMAIWWWSMTRPGFFPRRGCGSPSRRWAMTRLRCWMAACLPGRRRRRAGKRRGGAQDREIHRAIQSRTGARFRGGESRAGQHPDSGCPQRAAVRGQRARTARRPQIRPHAGRRQPSLSRGADQDGKLKDDAALQKLFSEKGVDLRAPIITSCGSGVTAAMVMLALEKLGARQVAVYDGSWTEWGGRDDAPMRWAR